MNRCLMTLRRQLLLTLLLAVCGIVMTMLIIVYPPQVDQADDTTQWATPAIQFIQVVPQRIRLDVRSQGRVTGSMQSGKPELCSVLKPEAISLGLTLQSLGEQVHHALYGLEVQRFFQDRDEIRVMLRLPSQQRNSLDHLYQLPIQLTNSQSVSFETVAQANFTPGFAAITRQDRDRLSTTDV